MNTMADRIRCGFLGALLLFACFAAPVIYFYPLFPKWLVSIVMSALAVVVFAFTAFGVCVLAVTAIEMLRYAITGKTPTRSIWDIRKR